MTSIKIQVAIRLCDDTLLPFENERVSKEDQANTSCSEPTASIFSSTPIPSHIRPQPPYEAT
jgi:hypothetical protein